MARAVRAARRMSVTPLIDVIFLLLLFFMLTSTFSEFSEVELTSGGTGATPAPADIAPMFVQLGAETVTLNGRAVRFDEMTETLATHTEDGVDQPVLVSLQDDVTAQRLTDLLAVVTQASGLNVTVLGGP